MARTTPTEYAEKWRRRLGGATEDVRRGINRVQQAPGQQAAAAQTTMLANLTESVTSGRWAQKVSGVSLQDWKSAAVDKGIPRIASGAQAAEGRMAQVAQTLLPAVDAAAAAARQIPKTSIEASVERAATFMRAMRQYKLGR